MRDGFSSQHDNNATNAVTLHEVPIPNRAGFIVWCPERRL